MKKSVIISLIVLAIIAVLVLVIAKYYKMEGPGNTPAIINNESPQDAEEVKIEKFFAKLRDKEKEITNLSYDAETFKEGTKVIEKFLKKGNKKRVESVAMGNEVVNIIDWDAKKSIVYLPKDKKAIVQVIADQTVNPMSQYSNMSAEEMSRYKLGEKTTKNGYACQMLTSEININDKPSTLNICISEEYGIPVFLEMNGATMHVTNISTNELDDALFVVPAGIEVIKK